MNQVACLIAAVSILSLLCSFVVPSAERPPEAQSNVASTMRTDKNRLTEVFRNDHDLDVPSERVDHHAGRGVYGDKFGVNRSRTESGPGFIAPGVPQNRIAQLKGSESEVKIDQEKVFVPNDRPSVEKQLSEVRPIVDYSVADSHISAARKYLR